jgi:dolichol-phosphate mannosyltransferase
LVLPTISHREGIVYLIHKIIFAQLKEKLVSGNLVIIPTYNEKENIAKMIRAVFELPMPFHVLVVDDASPDGTGQIVKGLQAQYPGMLHIEERQGKLGLGTAYIHGFRWGLERGYDYLIEMDADFSHNPKDLLRLQRACAEEGADVSVGSRYIKGGKVENWPFDRIFLSYGASLYVRVITWMPVKDPTAGFVCYRRQVLDTMDLSKIRAVGYSFQIEMKFASRSLGYKIKEVPIIFIDRVEGISKMSSSIIHEAVFGVLKMKWRSFFHSYARPKQA